MTASVCEPVRHNCHASEENGDDGGHHSNALAVWIGFVSFVVDL